MLNKNIFQEKKAQGMKSKMISPASSFFTKKAQMGETITWIVATLIIFLIVGSSIYAVTLLSKIKVIDYSDEKNSADILMGQSIFTYFSSENLDTRGEIYSNLERMDLENQFYFNFQEKFEEIRRNLG